MIVAGGAFVDPELANYFYRIGLPVAIGYGLTEACTVLTVNDLKPFRPDTVGAPVAGVELEIRDRDESGVGEVWVRSRTVMQGYLNAPEADARSADQRLAAHRRPRPARRIGPSASCSAAART